MKKKNLQVYKLCDVFTTRELYFLTRDKAKEFAQREKKKDDVNKDISYTLKDRFDIYKITVLS